MADWVNGKPCPHKGPCMICHVDHVWERVETTNDLGTFVTWNCTTCGEPRVA